MHRVITMVALVALLFSVAAASASEFSSPPEDLGNIEWWTDFPYHRNAMIDFGTDPFDGTSPWPEPGAEDTYPDGLPLGDYGIVWDLDPAVNYDLEGPDDPEIYLTDWFGILVTEPNDDYTLEDIIHWDATNPASWNPQPTSAASGILWAEHPGIRGDENIIVDFLWHIDNFPGDLGRIYNEIWMYDVDSLGNWAGVNTTVGYWTEDGYVPATNVDFQLGAGASPWYALEYWNEFTPNPTWEVMDIRVVLKPGEDQGLGDKFGLDSVHIAKEVPEPGTLALFGLGALGLVAWRRRKTS